MPPSPLRFVAAGALSTTLLVACTTPSGEDEGGRATAAFPAFAGPKFVEWKARYVAWAPDGSHLLVTLCAAGSFTSLSACRPWRYRIAERRWEPIALVPPEPDWSIESSAYSPDGRTIAATTVRCRPTRDAFPDCPYLEYRLALIDADSGRHRVLASERPRLLPSFTPDGKSLVHWQLDGVAGVPTGTTAAPARRAETLLFGHNVHVTDLETGQSRMALTVNAQQPLAPPRVYADGRRVTISAAGILGSVTTNRGVVEPVWNPDIQRVDSFLVGDLASGEIRAGLPAGHPSRLVFDVRRVPGTDADQVLYRFERSTLKVADPAGANETTVTPRFGPEDVAFNRVFEHAAFAPDSESFACVLGREVAIGGLARNAPIEIVRPPRIDPAFFSPSPSPRP